MIDGVVAEGLLIFVVIMCLQFPGKSNFGVIILSTRHSQRDVFLGASVGLVAATVVSVSLGFGAVLFLTPYLLWVKVAGGTVLAAFGLRELLRSMDMETRQLEEKSTRAETHHQARIAALTLAFILEMGDNTQILSILFVASTGNPLLVFVAACAGLITVTAVTIHGSKYLKSRVPPQKLGRILGAVLVAVGCITIVLAFFPGLLPFFG